MYKLEASFDDDGKLLYLFLRINKGKVNKTKVISSDEMVFADYDKKDKLLSVEFAEPTGLEIDKELLKYLKAK